MAESLGPYARAILRVRITFPPAYPSVPPLVTFGTDLFHPLLTPLTTYTYTTGASDSDTVSATDEERLPPGGFSLRHGFPQWFGRSRTTEFPSETSTTRHGGSDSLEHGDRPAGLSARAHLMHDRSPLSSGISSRASRSPASSMADAGRPSPGERRGLSAVGVLKYIRSAFDDESVLDSIPLQAAGNPGAWHAWRSHRAKARSSMASTLDSAESEGSESVNDSGEEPVEDQDSMETDPTESGRRPVQWNWEGVWEERVKKGIEGSLAEPVLFGSAGGSDEVVRFLNMEDGLVDKIKEKVFRRVESNDDV